MKIKPVWPLGVGSAHALARAEIIAHFCLATPIGLQNDYIYNILEHAQYALCNSL